MSEADTQITPNNQQSSGANVTYASYNKYHSNVLFNISFVDDLFDSLDAARVADILVFVTTYSQDTTELISKVR